MTKFNIKQQKEDVITKAVFKPSKKKAVDSMYWKTQDKILKEIFE